MLRNLHLGTRFVESLPQAERDALGVSVKDARRFERHKWAALDVATGRADLRKDETRQRWLVSGVHFAREAFIRE